MNVQLLLLLAVCCSLVLAERVAQPQRSGAKRRILLHPMISANVTSHLLSMERFGNFLADNGYDVYMLVMDTLPTRKHLHPKLTRLSVPLVKHARLQRHLLEPSEHWLEEANRPLQLMMSFFQQLLLECESIVDDEEATLLARLQAMNFSLIIYEGDCGLVVADYLGIPKVYYDIVGLMTLYHLLVPVPLAYYPMVLSPFTNQMTLAERMGNILTYILVNGMKQLLFARGVSRLYDDKLGRTGSDLTASYYNTSMVFLNIKPEFDYPIATMPNMLHIGAAFMKRPEEMDMDPALNELISNRKVIYVSLGTLHNLTQTEYVVIAGALSRLPSYRVVWQAKSKLQLPLADHIHTVAWVDQPAILSRNETQLFIGHGGLNSALEAAHYGVPYFVLPLVLDQHSICLRVRMHQTGRCFFKEGMTEDTLLTAIQEVLENPVYKKNAMRMSQSFQFFDPKPALLYWIRLLIDNNGWPFMESPFKCIPWYSYFMLDVIAITVVVFALSMAIALRCFRSMRRCCIRCPSKKKKAE